VFNDVPVALTDHVARELYGLEAGDVMAAPEAPDPRAAGAVAQPAAA
jgi:phosphonate transport system ATP-binding protein